MAAAPTRNKVHCPAAGSGAMGFCSGNVNVRGGHYASSVGQLRPGRDRTTLHRSNRNASPIVTASMRLSDWYMRRKCIQVARVSVTASAHGFVHPVERVVETWPEVFECPRVVFKAS